MKKMISLLAAAMLATVFAAGCAKTECKDATTKPQCETNEGDYFGKNKENLKGKVCKWVEKTSDKPAHCEEDKAATELALAKKACESTKMVDGDEADTKNAEACGKALDEKQQKLGNCKLKDDKKGCEFSQN